MNDFWPTTRRIFREPAFLMVGIVLLVGAVGLNFAIGALQLHLKKHPVPLSKPLAALPMQLGPWHQVSLDRPLPEEIQDALGTGEYIFRDFLNAEIVGMEQIERFRDRTFEERQRMLGEIRQRYPHAVVTLQVTYYTGLVDTVAHIPDRCYIAGGFQPASYEVRNWWGAERTIPVRLISFVDQTPNQRVPTNVVYFFRVNGRYVDDPMSVRFALQDLRQKYGYYAKVELMNISPSQEASAAAMADFIAHALGEIDQCLPDWNSVVAGGVN